MVKFIYENIIGKFIFDEDKDQLEELKGKKEEGKKGELKKLPHNKLALVLKKLREKEYFPLFYKKNIEITKKKLKESVTEDLFIIQAIGNINELDKVTNMLVKRLREWYSLYFPELSEEVEHHQRYIELVLSDEQKKPEDSMGADLEEVHVEEMKLLAKHTAQLYELREKHEQYLQKVMQTYCPNLLELAGATIGGKLIELSRSLKRLALLPASTVQLLGAEKALFRHIKTGSRSPKYGVIINHPLVQNAPRDKKGKAARMLADKLSLCARLDFFKGEFKAKDYRKELEEKLK